MATAKRARTIFSPSPTHLEVRLEAEMAKKVELLWQAMHFPIIKNIKTNQNVWHLRETSKFSYSTVRKIPIIVR